MNCIVCRRGWWRCDSPRPDGLVENVSFSVMAIGPASSDAIRNSGDDIDAQAARLLGRALCSTAHGAAPRDARIPGPAIVAKKPKYSLITSAKRMAALSRPPRARVRPTGAGDARAGPSAPAPLLAACTSTTWYVGFGFALLVQIPMAQRERRERRQEREGGLECVTRSFCSFSAKRTQRVQKILARSVLAWRP